MTKIDYKTLETEDLISLARKICEVVSENVDSAYDMISAEINRILEKEKDPGKSEDSFLAIDQLKKELQRRYDEGWGLIEKKVEEEEQTNRGGCQDRHFIGLNVNDYCFWSGYAVIGEYNFSYSRRDGKKGIPDVQLLKDRPFEWLVKYLKSNFYKEDPEEDYDEGFDE